MRAAAADSKSFRRGKIVDVWKEGKKVRKYEGFRSQLGVCVSFKDDREFTERYLAKVEDLCRSFGIEQDLPFYSSTHLKQIVGLNRAIPFADQLISEVQDMIDGIHCTFVILPPASIPTVQVGGLQCPVEEIETGKFIETLGPMFSYITASNFLHQNRFTDNRDLPIYIDAFRSKQTAAWDKVMSESKPSIFFRGDECNPLISCADMLAFLTDAKLYGRYLKLEPGNLKKVWEDYDFITTSLFLDDKTLGLYSWKTNTMIDFRKYLARPTLFLLIDELEKIDYGLEQEENEDIGVELQSTSSRPQQFHEVIKKSEVYYSAIKYAHSVGGSVKIFKRDEDLNMVSDNDILVYVGSSSQKVALAYKDAYEVDVLSGRDLRRRTKRV
jgi:hypothetical protein